ncbi:MAG TPA: thiamine-phosphate kinase [Methylomirabilota bacterium]|jgi:thiamine-monophosphate kinase
MKAERRASEDDLVRLVRSVAARPGAPGVRRSIGDDAAVLEPSAGTVLVATTDLLLEDVHFRRRWAEPADIGWKAMAVNVSDIAAMGATPRWALVALACPESTGAEEIEAFYEGALALCDLHGVVIVGGDTSVSPAGWTVNVTVLGETVAPVLRSTARAGDLVAVTGTLGRAGAGLAVLERHHAPSGVPPAVLADVTDAHLRPRPRVAEGRWLAGTGSVTAMMDLSDGLATDLPRLLVESGAGARIDLASLPVAPATRAVAAALHHDPIAWATGGGEDYELLVTCERSAVARLRSGLATATGTTLTAIGEIRGGAGVRWIDADGREAPVTSGFEHFSRG